MTCTSDPGVRWPFHEGTIWLADAGRYGSATVPRTAAKRGQRHPERDAPTIDRGISAGSEWKVPQRPFYPRALMLRLSPFTRLLRQFIQLAAFFVRTSQFTASKLRLVQTPALPFDIHPAHIR